MPKLKHAHCPRDGTKLEWIGESESQAMGCRLCGGLWIAKFQLDGRVDRATALRLFHGGIGRATSMRCPADGGLLFEFEVHGVLLDRCNHCGGIWFDAGELRAVLGTISLNNGRKPPTKNEPYLDEEPWWMSAPCAGDVILGILEFIFSP